MLTLRLTVIDLHCHICTLSGPCHVGQRWLYQTHAGCYGCCSALTRATASQLQGRAAQYSFSSASYSKPLCVEQNVKVQPRQQQLARYNMISLRCCHIIPATSVGMAERPTLSAIVYSSTHNAVLVRQCQHQCQSTPVANYALTNTHPLGHTTSLVRLVVVQSYTLLQQNKLRPFEVLTCNAPSSSAQDQQRAHQAVSIPRGQVSISAACPSRSSKRSAHVQARRRSHCSTTGGSESVGDRSPQHGKLGVERSSATLQQATATGCTAVLGATTLFGGVFRRGNACEVSTYIKNHFLKNTEYFEKKMKNVLEIS